MNVRAPYHCVFLCLLLGSSAVPAQIVTDGTVGPATSLSGPEMIIGAELGRTRGANLFHSFQRFDVPTGHQATFTGPEQIQNVIGRVTGGQTSNIDGTLRSTVGQADVYLINPSGIVMGPNAQVDVPAALHLSTADELRFSDGSRYSASDPANSTLTLAAPESFGFLSPQPASLTIEGSQLQMRPGKTATLTAGDVNISGTNERRALLYAPGGEIRVEAVGDRGGRVLVAQPSDQPGDGRATLDRARLETSGDGGGHLSVRAGDMRLDDTWLLAGNQGFTPAQGGIDLDIAGEASLTKSLVVAYTAAPGNSGRTTVRAGELRLDDSGISSEAVRLDQNSLYPIGAAGDVSVEAAGSLSILNTSSIASNSLAGGNAGAVSVRARTIEIDAFKIADQMTGITSQIDADSVGRGGSVSVSADETLTLLNGAQITSATFGSGPAGAIVVRAGSIHMDGGDDTKAITGISSQTGSGSTGQAGSVDVGVDGLLEALNGSLISSDIYGAGDGNLVTVRAGDLRLDSGEVRDRLTGVTSDARSGSTGRAGEVRIRVDGLLEVLHGAGIASSTFAAGDAGSVTIDAGALRLDGGESGEHSAGIETQANKNSTGQAGELRITVDGTLELLNSAGISSATFSSGDAKDVYIQARSLHADGGGKGATIASSTLLGSGQAGSVILDVSDRIDLRHGVAISSDTIGGTGHAGEVRVRTNSLFIDGTQATAGISSSSFSAGDAGTVWIDTNELWAAGADSGISSSAGWNFVTQQTLAIIEANPYTFGDLDWASSGQIGRIVIRSEHIRLQEGAKISIQAGQTLPELTEPRADAGIYIDTDRLQLDSGRITAASTGNVPASTVSIQARDVQLDHGSQITTSADNSNAGPIEIGGGRLWLTDSLITTSANGVVGDGGDIRLTPEYLILDGGFIQANTAAAGARGGDILIDSRALIASESLVEIGGAERQDFAFSDGRNIIQAAAPGGEQGTIDVSSPDLDITAALVPLATAFDDPDDLLTDLCQGVTGSAASSLVERGAGGLPTTPVAPASVSFMGERLDRVSAP